MSQFYAEISEHRVHIWFCFSPAGDARAFLDTSQKEAVIFQETNSLEEGINILKDWCDDWIVDNSWINRLGDVCGSWQIYKGMNKDCSV